MKWAFQGVSLTHCPLSKVFKLPLIPVTRPDVYTFAADAAPAQMISAEMPPEGKHESPHQLKNHPQLLQLAHMIVLL
jgi:hypothetical protein